MMVQSDSLPYGLVLQQLWASPYVGEPDEWRDIPIESRDKDE